MKTISVRLTADDVSYLSEHLADGIKNSDGGLIRAKASDPAAVLKDWRVCSSEYVQHNVRRGRAREDAEAFHEMNERDAALLERLLAAPAAVKPRRALGRRIEYVIPPKTEAAMIEQANALSIPVEDFFKLHIADVARVFEGAVEDWGLTTYCYVYPSLEAAEAAAKKFFARNKRLRELKLNYRANGEDWTETFTADWVKQGVVHA